MWAVSEDWIAFIDELNGGPRNRGNFIIRPSAYGLNQHAPDLSRRRGAPRPSGWAAGSTVYAPAVVHAIEDGEIAPMYEWNCQAYAVADGPSCRGAASPPLEGYGNESLVGCRACWAMPDVVVNYTAH
jgi:hypothetical protein